MLEKLKEMQKYGIFKLQPFDENLDDILVNAQKEEDLKEHLDSIKDYLKSLIDMLDIEYNVPIGKTLYDFYDKFTYELYTIYLEPMNYTTGVYSKETSFGARCKGSIGLKSIYPLFTVYERKILKIINHYYINLKSNSNFKDDYFYIPISQLYRMFTPGLNRHVIKQYIIDTSNRLSSKLIYWDLSKTKYNKSKKLTERKLNKCNGEKIIDIIPIYQIRGNTTSIKGIICKVNKFLKLRYLLRQISSLYPSDLLSEDYLSFAIADKLAYAMNLKSNQKKGIIIVKLCDLLQKIYDNGSKDTYFKILRCDTHKPRKQLYFFSSVILVAFNFMCNNYLNCDIKINVNNKNVCLIKNLEKVQVENEEKVYKNISKILEQDVLNGNVLTALICGKISLIINYKYKIK